MMLGRSLQFGKDDLIQLEGLNFRAKAYVDLTRHLGLDLHSYCLALPHQLGAVRHQNSTTLELYRQILERVHSKEFRKDEEVGRTAFARVPIPALSELVLARCKDSAAAIGLEILNLRQEQKEFRSYLTNFGQALTWAKSKRERWQLQNQFDAALKTLLEREDKQSTRFIYRIWDVIKEPTKMLAAFGDKVAVAGREKYIVGRARGLHDFWDGLAQGPPHGIAREQFHRLFHKRAEDGTWQLAEKLARALENTMMQDEPVA